MTAVAAAPERPRFSLEALQESRRARALLGVLLAAFVLGISYLIVLAFTGSFTNIVRINAELPAESNAVPIEAPVQYRNITVGKVGSETQASGGKVAVSFLIYPQYLNEIPAGVEAQVAPLSIFGNQYVNLVPPATLEAGHLTAGDFVAAYTGSASTSLQGTVTQLYNLLNAVHPAELDTALTAFAQALNGEGTTLGKALADTSDYSGTVAANLPQVESDIHQLSPFSQTLQAATPDILGTLSNSSVTAGTITSQQTALHDLLTAGTTSVGQFASVLQAVQTSLPELANESAPLLADVTQSPNELSQTLSGLGQFASAIAANEQQGPYLSVNANLPVADISAGVDAALGYNNPASVHQSLGALIDPMTYTAANCPEYPGESNPYCGRGGSPDAAPVSAASVRTAAAGDAADKGAPAGPAQAVGAKSGAPGATGGTSADTASQASANGPYASELAATDQIAMAISGGRSPAAPGFDEIVLYPLLLSFDTQQ